MMFNAEIDCHFYRLRNHIDGISHSPFLFFKPGANRSKRSKWGLALALFMVFLTLFDIVSAVR
jgi:hypothetical protein